VQVEQDLDRLPGQQLLPVDVAVPAVQPVQQLEGLAVRGRDRDRPKVIRNPEQYCCSRCGGRLVRER
ncbi:MAG: hypothetical protein SV186_06035, partial [Candidatus Nanohaloarchaea archaeon]|nr:hypothetical protein [Candidatus Nanohaloarchaea archaeon]